MLFTVRDQSVQPVPLGGEAGQMFLQGGQPVETGPVDQRPDRLQLKAPLPVKRICCSRSTCAGP